VQRLQDRNQSLGNPGLEEGARKLRQGAHRYRRQEAAACRNREWEVAILVENCKKDQASD
jgi:hypothetical protein